MFPAWLERSGYSKNTRSRLRGLITQIEDPRSFDVPELLLTLTARRRPRSTAASPTHSSSASTIDLEAVPAASDAFFALRPSRAGPSAVLPAPSSLSTPNSRGPYPPAIFNNEELTQAEVVSIQEFVEDYFEPSDPHSTVRTEAERDSILRELIHLKVDDFGSFYEFLLRARLLRLHLHQGDDYREALLARVLIKGLMAHNPALSARVLDFTNGESRSRRTNRLIDYIAREADGESDAGSGGSGHKSGSRSDDNDNGDDSGTLAGSQSPTRD
ncbi:hypothetical protein B0T22DRAFT_521566 [Podospora appendiculata]|uniref:Uncharacterized protein n=1 Tax=Podospora appendiculata TaxID=314037 RepID=A0AAE0X0S3_9PEZI|nr:hypothetical protein B0T22DRAFT_521566 [Podospora appendiculata]